MKFVVLALIAISISLTISCASFDAETIYTGDAHNLLLLPEDMPIGRRAEYPNEPANIVIKNYASLSFVSVEKRKKTFKVYVDIYPSIEKAESIYQDKLEKTVKTYSVEVAGVGNESYILHGEVATTIAFRRNNIIGQVRLETDNRAEAIRMAKDWAQKLDAKIRSKL